jgi:hypothetical protein
MLLWLIVRWLLDDACRDQCGCLCLREGQSILQHAMKARRTKTIGEYHEYHIKDTCRERPGELLCRRTFWC